MKKVLITGANSYIGVSFENYVHEHYNSDFYIDTVDMIDGSWRQKDFSHYDIVYHVAGIAHADVGNVSEETKKKYYAINTDLAIETAKKAKADGVRQFVFMSSAIIYGDSAPYGTTKRITRDTEPCPTNFYGDSKWQADKGVRELADKSFLVTVLRPPMIYGKGSKGNYPMLAKIAKKLPVFPDVQNERSMLYIENLCEFLCQVMIRGEGGIFWPQNAEYTKTSEMVKLIAEASGHKIRVSKAWNWAVGLAAHIPGTIMRLVNKAFGNMSYDMKMSKCGFDYQLVSFAETIKKSESSSLKSTTKKALMIASVASMIDQFNIPNIELLQSLGYSVDVVADFSNPGTISKERAKDLLYRLNEAGVQVFNISIPRSINLVEVIKAYRQVKQVINQEHYQLIHCHSPIGGAIARIAVKNVCKDSAKVIYTAHGFHFYKGAPIKNWVFFYPVEKWLSKYTDVLITINKEDYKRAKKKFRAKRTVYVPGIGIDLNSFNKRSVDKEAIRKELGIKPDDRMFLSVGELNRNKNHGLVIDALGMISTREREKVHYCIAGKDAGQGQRLKKMANKQGVTLHLLGYREDIPNLLMAADVFLLPSYREGLNVSLMEAMASGTLCLASNIRGNCDLLSDEALFSPFSSRELKNVLEKYYSSGVNPDYHDVLSFISRTSVKKLMEEVYRYAE